MIFFCCITGGVCIDIERRCDNINDCPDKSDEAGCSRVAMKNNYQKFIVPPPPVTQEAIEIDVKIGMDLSQIMDIRYLELFSWKTTSHKDHLTFIRLSTYL